MTTRWKMYVGTALAAALAAGSTGAEVLWFGGARRAFPYSLAANKESGIRSNWVFTDANQRTWDFSLGTDVSLWQRKSGATYQSFGSRFGIASRFQYNSKSFDLWGTDFRGGLIWGLRNDPMAYEIFLYHESSHLGDEIQERGDRKRIDSSINGGKVSVSRQLLESLRVYGGGSWLPIGDPEEMQSFGFFGGTEWMKLPPFQRGFLAVEAESWEWRDWHPDVTAQAGVCIGARRDGALISSARIYLEGYSGRVQIGQYHDETERHIAIGLANHW